MAQSILHGFIIVLSWHVHSNLYAGEMKYFKDEFLYAQGKHVVKNFLLCVYLIILPPM